MRLSETLAREAGRRVTAAEPDVLVHERAGEGGCDKLRAAVYCRRLRGVKRQCLRDPAGRLGGRLGVGSQHRYAASAPFWQRVQNSMTWCRADELRQLRSLRRL